MLIFSVESPGILWLPIAVGFLEVGDDRQKVGE
jgi:hypothetical protein